MTLTEIFLANSLFIWGVHVCFLKGMIFSFMRFDNFNWLWKPLFGCPACMGFWWSIPMALTVMDNLFQSFVYCICMVGFNWLIGEFKSYFEDE